MTNDINETKKIKILENIANALDTLPKEPIKKKTYLATIISDDNIKEFSLDNRKKLMAIDFQEGITEKQKIANGLWFIDTHYNFYIAGSNSEMKKGNILLACTKNKPIEGEKISLNILMLDHNNEATVSSSVLSSTPISNLTHIADNIYICILNSKPCVLMTGLENNIQNEVKLECNTNIFDASYG